jgi:hypothetical protein
MRMPEGGPRASSGFWCAFWLVSLVAFGALLWQYANVPEDGAVWESESEQRSEDISGRDARQGRGDSAGADRDERARREPLEPLEGDREEARGRDGASERAARGERPAPAPPLVIEPAPRFIANGPYVAQLGAFRAERSVRPAWDRLARRSPELFEEARLDVQRVEIKERGVFYRMRAGYFADRTNAMRFCQRLRAQHRDCMPVRR